MSDNEQKDQAEVRSEVRLRRPERMQMAMVVQCPDDLVGATHPVRMVMAVVEKLDLAGFYQPIKARREWRDAMPPIYDRLVALWLYGSIRGIGSARELARRCEESAAFRWLCGGVGGIHRLLSDFRTDHGDALEEVFTQVIASLVEKELISVSRVSQDGVRVRVSAGRRAFGEKGGCRNCWRKPSSTCRSCGGNWRSRSIRRCRGWPGRRRPSERRKRGSRGSAAGDRTGAGTERETGASGAASGAGEVRAENPGKSSCG